MHPASSSRFQGLSLITPVDVLFNMAFRDDALPGSDWWKKMNRHTQTPVNAVWFIVVAAGICGLIGFSETALTSLAGYVPGYLHPVEDPQLIFLLSASVIGLNISYVAPIFLRITSGRNKLVPGPFTLGKLSTPIGAVAVVWVTFVVVLLLFPPSQRTTAQDMSTSLLLFYSHLR